MRAHLTIASVLILSAPVVASAKVSLSRDATGHFLAPAFVNGKGPYLFMVDTGADKSAVYSWFAKTQSLPKGKSSVISGATGNAAETTSLIHSLSVDGREIKDVDADTIPDRPDGAKIAGIAGADLFSDRLVVLDPACGTIGFLPHNFDLKNIAGQNAILVHAGSIEDGKQLTFEASINGITGIAILDSGARSTIINTTFAHRAGIDMKSSKFSAGPTTRGATQQSVSSVQGPIGDVSLAGLVQRDVVARIVDLPAFEDSKLTGKAVVNVGADLLRDLRLTVDFNGRRFGLTRSSCTVPAAGNPLSGKGLNGGRDRD